MKNGRKTKEIQNRDDTGLTKHCTDTEGRGEERQQHRKVTTRPRCELKRIEMRLNEEWQELSKIGSKIDSLNGTVKQVGEVRPTIFPCVTPAGGAREGGFTVPTSIPADGIRNSDLVIQDPKSLEPGNPFEDSTKTANTPLRMDANAARPKRPRRKFIPFANCCSDAACGGDIRKDETVATPTPEKAMGVVTKEPHGINTVGDDTWVPIDVQVDSGATETVMSEATLQGVIDITEGPACKRGVTYEVANGADIPNLVLSVSNL